MKKHAYKKALYGLQIGLAARQRQIIAEERRLLVIFEGRDILAGVPSKGLPQPLDPADPDILRLWSPGDRPDDFLAY
ncbi:MAG: hypothetical protein RIA71_06180 [Oceanicaulis sp.]